MLCVALRRVKIGPEAGSQGLHPTCLAREPRTPRGRMARGPHCVAAETVILVRLLLTGTSSVPPSGTR